MLSSLIIALAAITSTYAQVAEWHMDILNTLVMERLDPIVSPNAVAGHMHRILGGSGFGASYDFASARKASCTTASITADKSNYWAPQLYWINGNNSFVPLPAFTRFYYKLGRNSAKEPVSPFPEGLRMLTGNPNSKSNLGIAQFTCHVNSDLTTGSINQGNFNYKRDCPYGLRVEMFFPPCWDGKNLYLSDQSHMAWPAGQVKSAQGQCPWDHPIRVPQIMLEYTFKPSSWAPGKALAGNLAWANGDTTGYGVHADFTNGWDTQVLGTALNNSQCAGSIGSMRIQDCQALKSYYDPNAAAACKPDKGVMYEVGQKNQDLVPVPALPGCNPIWGNTATKPTCSDAPTNPSVTSFTGADGSLIPTSNLPALPLTPGWQQLGCIKDTGALLSGVSSWYYDTKLTATQCQSICRLNGMNYAAIGMSDSRWDCQCGTGLLSTTSWYPGMCTAQCPGNSSQVCGGTDIHSIWYAPPGTDIAPSTVVGPDASQYMGCYSIDNSKSTNLISGAMSAFDADSMTNEYCITECAKQGATWAATTNTKSCNCGKDYQLGDGFYVSDVSCSWNCAGDSTQKCGAYRTFFSVYNVTGVPTANGTDFPPGRNGCFKDPGSKGLSGFSWTNAAMTVDQCQYGCAELGYSLAGLTSGNRCRCGNTWSGGSPYPDSQCPMTCTGSKNSTCGGNYLTEVYQTAPVQSRLKADIAARPAGWSGCYTNSDNKLFTSYYRYDSINTVERCKSTCKGMGYAWADVENQSYCKCGNVDPSTIKGALPSNVYCRASCPGNKAETCGAAGHYAEAYNLQAQASSSTSTLASSTSSSSSSASASSSASSSTASKSSTSSGTASSISTSSAASAAPSDGPASSSVGCFADPSAMGGTTYNSGYMTVDTCLFYCKNSGYNYAGLQNGNTCRCSNITPKIQVGQSYCTSPCASNSAQTCGSASNIQVWPVSASSNFVDPYSAAGAGATGYMGCWNDWSGVRMLKSSSYSANGMTTSTCRFNCLAQGYNYSGTESGNQCWCSNALTTDKGYQRRPDSDCNMACFGNKSIKCGGTWKISVFAAQGNAPAASSTQVSTSTSSASTTDSTSGTTTGSASSGTTSASSASSSSSSAPSTPSSSVSSPGYQGCYALGSLKSASQSFKAYAKMTPQYCQRYCMAYGFVISGVQGGNNCFCGSTSALGAQQSDAACSAPCSGDSSKDCGDTYMASVYTSSPAAPGYPQDYVGCYNDASTRVLRGWGTSSGGMTSSMCGAMCAGKGYAVYGTEASNECYCGPALPTVMTGDEKCTYACKGNGTEKCGGSYKLSVYKTGWAALAAPEQPLSVSLPALSTSSSSSTSSTVSTSTAQSSTTVKSSSTSSTTPKTSTAVSTTPASSKASASKSASMSATTSIGDGQLIVKSSSAMATSKTTSSSTSSAAPSPTPSGYIGCFPTSSNTMQDTITSSDLTVANCQAWCGANSFTYSAVAKGNTCGCTNSPPTANSLAITQCATPCAGAKGTCGGSANWAVYTVPAETCSPTKREYVFEGAVPRRQV